MPEVTIEDWHHQINIQVSSSPPQSLEARLIEVDNTEHIINNEHCQALMEQNKSSKACINSRNLFCSECTPCHGKNRSTITLRINHMYSLLKLKYTHVHYSIAKTKKPKIQIKDCLIQSTTHQTIYSN